MFCLTRIPSTLHASFNHTSKTSSVQYWIDLWEKNCGGVSGSLERVTPCHLGGFKLFRRFYTHVRYESQILLTSQLPCVNKKGQERYVLSVAYSVSKQWVYKSWYIWGYTTPKFSLCPKHCALAIYRKCQCLTQISIAKFKEYVGKPYGSQIKREELKDTQTNC